MAAENCILRAHLPPRLRITTPERPTLAEIGKRVGRKALKDVACVVKPDTILAWYRRLIAKEFDGSKFRSYPGRPRISREVTDLILQMAKENSGWGYDRIARALANLGVWSKNQNIAKNPIGCGNSGLSSVRTKSRRYRGSRTVRYRSDCSLDHTTMCKLVIRHGQGLRQWRITHS